jgi:hypothetical protein
MTLLSRPVASLVIGSKNEFGLIENDDGCKGILLSLFCLLKLFFPKKRLPSLILMSRERPPRPLCVVLCYTLFKELGCPQNNLKDDLSSLETYVLKIFKLYREACKSIWTVVVVPTTLESVTEILSSLEQQWHDLGWIDWWRITTTDFAVVVGFRLGEVGWFVRPKVSMEQILGIATDIAHKAYTKPYQVPEPHQNQLPRPKISWVCPNMPNLQGPPTVSELFANMDLGPPNNNPEIDSDSDTDKEA